MTSMTGAANLLAALPGRYYTDPAVFELDQRQIFRRSWLCVGRAEALSEPGRYRRIELGEESVLVVRGRDGELGAFLNLCRHRGAQLCSEESGSFSRTIRCTYHSWSYGLDGRLLAAPNMRDMPDLVRADYGLHPVRAEQWLGYLWLNLDPEAQPLAAQVEPQLAERLGDGVLERYGIERLGVAATIDYSVAANWKSIIENFMECYHCASIHPELTAALPQFRSGYGTISDGMAAGASFAEHVDGFSLSGRATHPRLPGLGPSDDRLFYGLVLRPNVLLILVPDHVALYRLEPLGPGHTRVTVDWLFDRDTMAGDGFDATDAIALLDITNRQDFDACERCQRGMRSAAYSGVLVPAEHVITDFYAQYLAAIGEHPAGSPRERG